ncbi:hypothetical protein ACN2MM_12675 [Alkalilimnicola ehrlichii MLHE-1]|uniref:DUF432 domain-containing protein n=1 Tax=Alkalilimnicola ehrlichii (strain ATCC BAA-1101 / DSM 17681 / MLHE-1) TaxID=187272 RepID=Q0A615_ALKEH|nr:hypothetical protein [Alkalilimnicola ehrlichii]ABI57722.1 conserved hypothetical protein [Alkalilimnicola ehrlichii MLHE-1]
MSGSQAAGGRVARWYGDFNIAQGFTRQWLVGPMRLRVHHGLNEWRLLREQDPDPWLDRLEMVHSDDPALIPEGEQLHRVVLATPESRIHLELLPADRAVVSRPVSPVSVPGGEAVRVYVSTPVWVRVTLGERQHRMLEQPSYRPSDTWFGPSNMEGEICYATRSRFRLTLAEQARSPARVITPVQIRNQAADPLTLDRLNVPMPWLPLYADQDDHLWTPEVGLTRRADGDLAELRFTDQPPRECHGGTRLSAPRQSGRQHTAFRAFTQLLRG